MIAHAVYSQAFVAAIMERAGRITDTTQKKSVLSEVEYARKIVAESDN